MRMIFRPWRVNTGVLKRLAHQRNNPSKGSCYHDTWTKWSYLARIRGRRC